MNSNQVMRAAQNLYEEGQELGLEGQELLDYVEEQFEQRGV